MLTPHPWGCVHALAELSLCCLSPTVHNLGVPAQILPPPPIFEILWLSEFHLWAKSVSKPLSQIFTA